MNSDTVGTSAGGLWTIFSTLSRSTHIRSDRSRWRTCGYRAAEHAAAAGFTTVLVEKGLLGGVCLNEGCIPSKTMLHCVKGYSEARDSQAFGVQSDHVTLDLARIMARKEKTVKTLRKGIAFTLKKGRVTVESGRGALMPREGRAFRVQLDDRVIEGKRLLVCTGSEAIRLPVPGADAEYVYTNKEILSIDHIPQRLAIIGGGAIGLEFADFFAEAGSQVTVIELLPSVGGKIDPDIARILKREMEKKGIQFKLEANVTGIRDHGVSFSSEGQEQSVAVDIVLMSVGRRPIVKGFGLEHTGVAIEGGAIVTDGRGRTNVEGMWAAGDVNGVSMLAHTAYRESLACVNDMRGIEDVVNYDAIPWVIYTHPEAAGVGLTESDAQKRGIEIVTAKLPLSSNGRYLAETEGERGRGKVVIDKKSKTILGVHMAGTGVTELIFGAAMMVEKNDRRGYREAGVSSSHGQRNHRRYGEITDPVSKYDITRVRGRIPSRRPRHAKIFQRLIFANQ